MYSSLHAQFLCPKLSSKPLLSWTMTLALFTQDFLVATYTHCWFWRKLHGEHIALLTAHVLFFVIPYNALRFLRDAAQCLLLAGEVLADAYRRAHPTKLSTRQGQPRPGSEQTVSTATGTKNTVLLLYLGALLSGRIQRK